MSENSLEEENELKRKKAFLTHSEWMTFFFLPFLTPKNRYRDDHFSDSEMERFKKYGFENKMIEAYKAKRNGRIFWLVVIALSAMLLVYLERTG